MSALGDPGDIPRRSLELTGSRFVPASDNWSESMPPVTQTLFNLQLSEPGKGGPVPTMPVGL